MVLLASSPFFLTFFILCLQVGVGRRTRDAQRKDPIQATKGWCVVAINFQSKRNDSFGFRLLPRLERDGRLQLFGLLMALAFLD